MDEELIKWKRNIFIFRYDFYQELNENPMNFL